MSGRDRSVILIAGPTASGKSAAALALADRTGAIVVNADSMQVYRDLAILTARPSIADEARVPHRLYGHLDGAEPYSTGRYVEDAARILNENRAAPLIFVGGTGLYFEALTKGISPVPPVPPEVRERVRRLGEQMAPGDLHRVLAERDPGAAARLRPSDPQRLLRALEVFEATGRSLLDWQQMPGRPLVQPSAAFVLAPERAVLRERIAQRFAWMMQAGAMAEIERLAVRDLDPDLPCMRALGVAPLIGLLRGEIAAGEAERRVVTQTRQYAKRQETWFRNRMADWPRVAPERAAETIHEALVRA